VRQSSVAGGRRGACKSALNDPEALAEAVARGGARRAIRSHLRLCRVDGRLGIYLRTRLSYVQRPWSTAYNLQVGRWVLVFVNWRTRHPSGRPVP
jgi:hypothetical protein